MYYLKKTRWGVLVLFLVAPTLWAQEFSIQGGSLASGTALAAGSGLTLFGTAGQPMVGGGGNATATIQAGFWPQLQGVVTNVAQEEGLLPHEFRLDQNFPNPFNPTTTIRFALPTSTAVELKVYDALGREVSTLANGPLSAGEYSVEFETRNLASGVYFYRLTAGEYVRTKKMVLMK